MAKTPSKPPRKTAVVNKKLTDVMATDADRWNSFTAACQVPWDDLSDEWKDFFFCMGETKSTAEMINSAIDKARES